MRRARREWVCFDTPTCLEGGAMSKAEQSPRGTSGVSRRAFLKGSGAAAAASALAGAPDLVAKDESPKLVAGATTITLQVNGQSQKVEVEPRTTLLEAL